MKNDNNSILYQFALIVSILTTFSSCSVTKKYHSHGFQVSSIFSSPNSSKFSNKIAKTNNANKSLNQPVKGTQLKPILAANPTTGSNLGTNQNNRTELYSVLGSKFASALLLEESKPLDTVFFPEKIRNNRRHRNIFIPHIDEEPNFNLLALKAHNRDDRSWSRFDKAFQLGKLTLIWLVGAIGLLIVVAAFNINLAVIGAMLQLLLKLIFIGLPAFFIILGYLYYILGSLSLARATSLYKKAITTLSPEYKLRGDAVVMHARIPFVSRAKTIKTGKRILKQYPNNYYGEWLQDVSKTLTEIVTKRTSLTIDNWKVVKSLGLILTILIAVGTIAFLFV